jgi:hypothetical protein
MLSQVRSFATDVFVVIENKRVKAPNVVSLAQTAYYFVKRSKDLSFPSPDNQLTGLPSGDYLKQITGEAASHWPSIALTNLRDNPSDC